MRAVIVPADVSHIAHIVEHARIADVEELLLFDATPELCMDQGVKLSLRSWTALWYDEPACMFGLMPDSVIRGTGIPWMVGTTALETKSAQKELLRLCRPYVDAMQELLPDLSNTVDDRNEAAKRWLRWLGFTVGEPFSYRTGVLCPFTKRKD